MTMVFSTADTLVLTRSEWFWHSWESLLVFVWCFWHPGRRRQFGIPQCRHGRASILPEYLLSVMRKVMREVSNRVSANFVRRHHGKTKCIMRGQRKATPRYELPRRIISGRVVSASRSVANSIGEVSIHHYCVADQCGIWKRKQTNHTCTHQARKSRTCASHVAKSCASNS